MSENFAMRHSERVIARAERGLFCSQITLKTLANIIHQSIDLKHLCGDRGFQEGYTKKVMSEGAVESELMWLIQLGMVRREVDGQGITDSFRLTPLGKEILDKWQGQQPPNTNFLDRGINLLHHSFYKLTLN